MAVLLFASGGYAMANNFSYSDAGFELTKQFEGLRLTAQTALPLIAPTLIASAGQPC